MKLKQFITKYFYALILVAISLVAYWRWLLPGIFTHSDLWFQFNGSLKNFLAFPIWISNMDLGRVDVTFWRTSAYNWMLGASSYFPNGFSLAEKVSVMMPITLLGATSGYYIARQIVGDKRASFVAGLVFGFNTYFLAINTQGHLLLTLAAILSTFSLGFFIRAIKLNARKYSVLSAIALLLATGYDLRFAYILFGIVIGYVIFCVLLNPETSRRHGVKTFFVFAGTYVLLNIYWLLPAFFSGSGLSNSQLGRELFGNEFWRLTDAIALHHPFWTGGSLNWFKAVNPQIYLWVLPLLAFAGLYKNRQNKEVIYFGVVGLIGILLSKQVDQPLTNLYPFLYDHLPGFNAFREATKFYYPIALSYAILIAALVARLGHARSSLNRQASVGVVAVVIALTAVNIFPQISGSLATMFKTRTVPADYQKLEQFITNQNAFFRTLWMPGASRWAVYSNQHPMVDVGHMESQEWKQLIRETDTAALSRTETKDSQIDFLQKSYAQNILNSASIKYVIVPLQDNASDDDFYKYYGYYRKDYIAALDKIDWLKRVQIGTNDVAVFENTNYQPYATAFTKLTNYTSYAGLQEQFKNFGQSQPKDQQFAVGIKDMLASTNIRNLFSGANSFSPLGSTVSARAGHDVIANTNNLYDYALIRSPTAITLNRSVARTTNLYGGGALTSGATAQIPIDNSDYYYSQNGQTLTRLVNGNNYVDTRESQLTVYKKGITNSIKSPQFRDNLDEFKLENCNKTGNSPLIRVSFPASRISEGKSLQLSTSNDVGCATTHSLGDIRGQQMISFSYKVIGSQQAAYELLYDTNSGSQSDYNPIPVTDQNLHQLQRLVALPNDARNVRLRLYGYPDDQQKQIAYTTYDALNIYSVTQAADLSSLTRPDFNIDNAIKQVSVAQPGLDPRNRVNNGSFESGLWQKKVGDCNNFDDKPIIGMALDSARRTEGKQSLKLYAQNHVACTRSQSFAIQPNGDYLLAFDYAGLNTAQAGYSVSFNDPDRTQVNTVIDNTSNKWQHKQALVSAPNNGTEAYITLYSYANEEDNSTATNWYDQVSFVSIPGVLNQYYDVQTNAIKTQQPGAISVQQLSPTHKVISIKRAQNSFYLGIAEAFNGGWKLEMGNKVVAADKHFMLNGYANGWLINTQKICGETSCTKNADGTYDIVLIANYAPQQYFYIGLAVSGIALAGGVLFIVFSTVRRGRRDD